MAEAIGGYTPAASAWPHYFAALLLRMQGEAPIPSGTTFFFGSVDLVVGQQDGELKMKTLSFIAVGNLVRLFFDRMSLTDILVRSGDTIQSGRMR